MRFISVGIILSALFIITSSSAFAAVKWCVVNNNGQIIACVPTRSSCLKKAKMFSGATCIAQ